MVLSAGKLRVGYVNWEEREEGADARDFWHMGILVTHAKV